MPDMIEESINLHDSDYSSILKLIFTPDNLHTSGACYCPRNGILFFGNCNEFLGFIEICFQCKNEHTVLVPSVEINGDDYKQLKKLFTLYNISTHDY